MNVKSHGTGGAALAVFVAVNIPCCVRLVSHLAEGTPTLVWDSE